MKFTRAYIQDRTGGDVFDGMTFVDFEDAEEYLRDWLGDKYETNRKEYKIILFYF